MALNNLNTIKLLWAQFNTTLPSSAPVERLFSFAVIIFHPHRRWLTQEIFEMLVPLKHNKIGSEFKWLGLNWHVFELDRRQVFFCFLQFCLDTVAFYFLFSLPIGFKLSPEPCVPYEKQNLLPFCTNSKWPMLQMYFPVFWKYKIMHFDRCIKCLLSWYIFWHRYSSPSFLLTLIIF